MGIGVRRSNPNLAIETDCLTLVKGLSSYEFQFHLAYSDY